MWARILLLLSEAIYVASMTEDKTQVTLSYNLTEECDVGTVIGNILNDAHFRIKYSPEDLEFLKLTFSRQPSLPFGLNSTTGDLITLGRIDREQVCEGKSGCIQSMNIIADPMYEIIPLNILIQDINDNTPTFPRKEVEYQLPESADYGATIVLATALDPDSEVFGVQDYVLIPKTGLFELKMKEKVDGSEEIRLELVGKLDREKESSHHMQIQAYDGGSPPKIGRLNVKIIVQDANDNNPVFEKQTYTTKVPEDTPLHTTVIKVHASDADIGDNGEVLYWFSEATHSTAGQRFGIIDTTGEIYIRGALDHEQESMYDLLVLAQDKGQDSVPSEATVIVQVTDVNDNPPDITISILSDGKGQKQQERNANRQKFLAHMTVKDPDTGINGMVHCELSKKEFKLEKVNDDQYTIESEGDDWHSVGNVIVTCSDNADKPLKSSKSIIFNGSVRVGPVNSAANFERIHVLLFIIIFLCFL